MSYDISTTGEWITMRFFEKITAEDFQRSVEEIEAIEASSDIVPFRLTDISDSDTVYLSFPVIEGLAARRRAALLKNPVRSAIVAPTLPQYGFSRMFQILNDNPRIDVEVFRSLDEAVAWLKSDPDDLSKRLTTKGSKRIEARVELPACRVR